MLSIKVECDFTGAIYCLIGFHEVLVNFGGLISIHYFAYYSVRGGIGTN